jgi:heme/copper-type cytochrome/quinol oxidase subunit 1
MALVFFVIALLLALLISARSPLNLDFPASAFSPVFFHLFMVGWVTQLIFGVVFWMFPKYTREKPRGSEALGWVVFWLLNLGLVLRLVGEPAQVLYPGVIWGVMLAASALIQWVAGVLFVLNTWGRVKER